MARATRAVKAGVGLVAVALAAAACGGSSGGGNNPGAAPSGSGGGTQQGNDQVVIWGTTDTPVSFDPAGSYDLPSWNVVYNVYQTLVRLDAQTQKPVADAATSCDASANFKTWTCTLKQGNKFSNGDPLTANDVKYSIDRTNKIKAPNGPSSLFANIKSVDAKDPQTVVFSLKAADPLFDYILSTGAGAIVDAKVFPADKLMADAQVIGSGPYQLKAYQQKQVAQFVPNKNYQGDVKVANGGVVIQYYQDENTLKLDVKAGKVDIAYRNLSPTSIADLRSAGGDTKVIEGPGGEIRYLVFNLNTMPGGNPAQKLAIRRAIAYSIDRQAIAKDVYQGTVDALYSMVPDGLDGHSDVFKSAFGASPDKAKAQQELQKAGVQTPVKLQIWWVPEHYGPLSSDEYTEIKRQLESTGLFKVDLQSTSWDQYINDALSDKYPIFQLGWFPDYPDTDDYVAQFFGGTSFLNNHYDNPKASKLIADEKSSRDAAKRTADFKQIQQVTVNDASAIPIWQGKQIAVSHGTVNGLQGTLLPDYIFRFWVLSKS